jgi:tRNA (guanine-N7-)-methyltransferase
MVQEIEKLDRAPAFVREHRQKMILQVKREMQEAGLFEGTAPFLLEIGSGHGDWLAAYAAAHPAKRCVGIEILGQRLRKCVRKAKAAGAENTAFFKTEGTEFLEALGSGNYISEAVILFPDPWPKGRHYGRRLVQPTFLRLLAEASTADARLYFRTDDWTYIKWTRERIAESLYWEEVDEPWIFERATVFQNYAAGYDSIVARRLEI